MPTPGVSSAGESRCRVDDFAYVERHRKGRAGRDRENGPFKSLPECSEEPNGIRYGRAVITETSITIVLAFVVLVTPLLFLASVAAAIIDRRRRGIISRRLSTIVAFTGGLALGSLWLIGNQLVLVIPLLGVPIVLAVSLWRARRRAPAGWLLAGLALPWTLLRGFYLLVLVTGIEPFEPAITIGSFLLGFVPLMVGLGIARRGDPPPVAPSVDAPAGQPGSHKFGSIATAIREPTLVGPFGQPEVAMVVALVAVWLVVPIAIPSSMPVLVRLALLSFVGAVVATEGYVRAFPTRSRRALEAFSWFGEWELARARAVTGGSIPTSRAGAVRWLADRPERTEEAAYRVESLLVVGRVDDARSLLARLPATTPRERFEYVALHDLVEWRAGGDGDLAALEAAADAIPLPDEDDRLRAEVVVAVAKVRRRMADGIPATDAIQPFLDVRERLGERADGQVGRAFRRKLIPVLLVASFAFGVVGEVLGLMP